MKPSRALLDEILAPVSDEMARVRRTIAEQIADASPAVSDMVSHVERFHGKQLRAALVLLTGEATGNTTDEHAAVAAIVEMIHLATLVHDDILDGAHVRRRVASVNERWDNQIAVLLGDFLYARAFALSTELSSRLCSRLLSETTRRLCVGEIEQSTRRYDFEMSEEQYEAVCRAKTASLYSAACELGARSPGGNDEVAQAMARMGDELGLAFQIVDDCLDLTGDQRTLGKTVGTDVEDGKVTLPVLYTYRHGDDAVRARIRDTFTEPELADRAARLRERVDLGAGLDHAMARAHELLQGARSRLASLPASPARSSIERMTDFFLERSF